MKHSTEELIFAALLRERMRSLRMSKIRNMSDEEAADFDRQPVDALVEEAMEEMQDIANLIKVIRAREPAPQKP